MFRYKNIKLTGAWTHDDGTKYPKDWVDGAEPQQLIDIGVETVADIDPPNHDQKTQYITEQADGSYIISPLTIDQVRSIAKNELTANLNNMSYVYPDGRIIQTRPSDLTNLQLTIAKGVNEEWVMTNNTLSILTPAELQEALDAGITNGSIYWDEYKDVIRSLT